MAQKDPEEKKEHSTAEEIKAESAPLNQRRTEDKVNATSAQNRNFFDDFQNSPGDKKSRFALFFIFALLIVGLFYLAKPTIESYLYPKPSVKDYIPVSQEPTSMHLEIKNPSDEILTFDKTINISGKTSPKSSVVISNGSLNWGLDANEGGEFSKVIDLKPGINEIIIYAFDSQGNNKTESRLVYMSEEKIWKPSI